MPIFLTEDKWNIARGLVKDTSFIHKFGANFDIDTNSDPETVWSAGGLYPWDALATAQTLYIQSDDAADTSSLEIQGLDENYELLTEEVQMNGTTTVTTTNTFIRVYRMIYNHTAVNVGTVTARVTSGAGTVVAQIDPDYAQTLMCIYTVPAGYTAYLLAGDASLNKAEDGNIRFYQRPFGRSFKIAHMAEIYENWYRYDFPIPLPLPEKTDLDVRIAEVETNNTRCTANFDLVLIKN